VKGVLQHHSSRFVRKSVDALQINASGVLVDNSRSAFGTISSFKRSDVGISNLRSWKDLPPVKVEETLAALGF